MISFSSNWFLLANGSLIRNFNTGKQAIKSAQKAIHTAMEMNDHISTTQLLDASPKKL